ncbi:MAG TPA: HAD family hydrolase [Gaiellaceae bacterium]|jgi:FMN phosphatase YigB (HAD superfamily)|nr:HAD family hydrolase [Gaiellaceae bacterium]
MSRRPSPAAVLVWDFDGTLYRGIAACLHYARGIADTLEPGRRATYLQSVERYLAGQGGVDAADGWEAAVMLAGGGRGASRAFGDAFARTRAFMLTDACELEVPDGMHSFLERMSGRARRVLVSNTPAFGVVPMLERLGLLNAFDELSCDSAKPYRFSVRLRTLAELHEVEARSVISIGDHFVNDIEPAFETGCSTAYIDPFAVGPRGRADLEAPRFEDLLEPLESWVEAREASIVGTGAR